MADNLRDRIMKRFVIEPLGNYLVQKAQSDAHAMPVGAVLRDQINLGTPNDTSKRKMTDNIPFQTLRNFSVQYDVARAAINRRKRQLNQLDWDIVAAETDDDTDYGAIKTELRTMFKQIGGYRVRFREFMDTIVEDLLVLDAVAIYKRPNKGGSLYNLQVLDSATIQLRVDETGGTPMPPEVAYKQIIRGTEVATFTADEMYYEMMNPRTSSPYGLSPLESLVLGISTALKSELYNLHLLTEGNIPEGFFGVPESWRPKEIKEYQELWDAMLAGDTRATAKLRFVPDGKYQPAVKPEDMRYKELQEWLMKKTCMLFEMPPNELGFTDTVNKSVGEVQQQIANDTGLKPLANFFEEIFTDVIQQDFGYSQLKFEFKGLEYKDEKAIAETNEILIRSGQRTVDELRTDEGLKPLGVDKPFVMGNPTFIDNESIQAKADATAALAEAQAKANEQPPAADPPVEDKPPVEDPNASKSAEDKHIELVTEFRTFKNYAVNRVKLGKNLRPFVSEVLPENVVDQLNSQLQKAKSTDEVRSIFKDYMDDYQVEFLANVVQLKNDLNRIV